jgi:Tfp pilus assembly protein FimT
MKNLKNYLGYSLAELLVALVVMSFLATLLMPSYSGFKTRRAISYKVWEIKRSLEFARSIAVTRHMQIKACMSDVNYRCVKRFGTRLVVFFDRNKDHQWTPDESIFRDTEIGEFDIKLSASGRAYVRYKRSGESLESGNFLVCSADAGDFGRKVIFFYSGRIRLSKDADKDGCDVTSGAG